MNREIFDTFRSAIFAGICIGLAGFGFLVNSTIGMFLFIFGLATVVHYQLKLFTGTAGFITSWKDFWLLLLIWVGNFCGCLLISIIATYSNMYSTVLMDNAVAILHSRISLGPLNCGILAICCGILMTTAVTFARKGKEFGNWVPLLFAVPLFILCGFPHCIADIYYYACVPLSDVKLIASDMIKTYGAIMAGNFIGCNLYRLFV